MNTKILATFHDRDHAEPVARRLEEAGFHPTLRDESKWQDRHLCEHLASVKVEVEAGEYEAAHQRLEELDKSEHFLEQAVSCPECGSPDVDYPQVTRKFIMPALHTVMYQLGFAEKEFYCHTCHHLWPTRTKIEPERDELNWPIKNGRLHENTDMTP